MSEPLIDKLVGALVDALTSGGPGSGRSTGYKWTERDYASRGRATERGRLGGREGYAIRQHWGKRGKPKDLARSKRAKESHNAVSLEKYRLHEVWASRIAQVVGGTQTKRVSNWEVDITSRSGTRPRFGIEVKTIHPGAKQTRLNVHSSGADDTLKRKRAWARRFRAGAYMVGVDLRGKSPEFFVREGFAGYSLGSMTRVPTLEALAKFIQKGGK
jgi:hypothetical protein